MLTKGPAVQASGELHVELTYRQFEDDETDPGYREAEAYALALQQHAITDVKVSQVSRAVLGCGLLCCVELCSQVLCMVHHKFSVFKGAAAAKFVAACRWLAL